MRISDWSSDVCSSDLSGPGRGRADNRPDRGGSKGTPARGNDAARGRASDHGNSGNKGKPGNKGNNDKGNNKGTGGRGNGHRKPYSCRRRKRINQGRPRTGECLIPTVPGGSSATRGVGTESAKT